MKNILKIVSAIILVVLIFCLGYYTVFNSNYAKERAERWSKAEDFYSNLKEITNEEMAIQGELCIKGGMSPEPKKIWARNYKKNADIYESKIIGVTCVAKRPEVIHEGTDLVTPALIGAGAYLLK